MWHLAMAPRALLLTRAAAPTFLHCYVLSALPVCEGAVANQGGAPACVCVLLLPRVLQPPKLPHGSTTRPTISHTLRTQCAVTFGRRRSLPGGRWRPRAPKEADTTPHQAASPPSPSKLTNNLLTPNAECLSGKEQDTRPRSPAAHELSPDCITSPPPPHRTSVPIC